MQNWSDLRWPNNDFSAVPYPVFYDQEVFNAEQERVFRGPLWCYAALQAEIPNPGDYKSTFVGDTPIVVDRAEDGTIHAFVNRCAHRGTLLVRDQFGNRRDHTCIYHHWVLRPRRQPDRRAVPARPPRQGRHAQGLQDGRPRAAQAQRRHLQRGDLRLLRRRSRAADRLPGRADARHHRPAVPAPDRGAGLHAPAHPRQLEALLREPDGRLPRRPAAPVPDHLRDRPQHPGRRLDPRQARPPPHVLHHGRQRHRGGRPRRATPATTPTTSSCSSSTPRSPT